MDKITQLLTDLAAKLGTIVQYLWGVIVRQSGVAMCRTVKFCVLLFSVVLLCPVV